ncbi:response regulator transcription factor [Spirillospora sp. NPDC047279]|uniref:response regulator transcription factor n=1 Tax=Spirillospora sp. NPDC047279 TaxID=3155478 RepID=UPI0034115807
MTRVLIADTPDVVVMDIRMPDLNGIEATRQITTFAAIRTVAAGGALIAPSITRRLIADFTRTPRRAHPRPLPTITTREREVLTLVGQGLSNAEIAVHLTISPATAKAHISRLFTKLNARDRVHLVIIAYESGLVAPPS